MKICNAMMLAAAVAVSTGPDVIASTAYVDGGAEVSGLFPLGDRSSQIPYGTRFAFRDGGGGLRLDVAVDYPHMNAIFAATNARPWSCGDCVEVWLDPSGAGKVVFQFAIGADGTLWDRRNPGMPPTGWSAQVKRRENGWSFVAEFPYADLGVAPPKKGDRWRGNVCRTYLDASHSVITHATWADVESKFDNPARFADLFFGSAEEERELVRRRRMAALSSLRDEIRSKGLDGHFAFKMKRLEDGAPETLVGEIVDEMRVLENLR